MIRFDDVVVQAGARRVLDGVRLELKERRVAMIGANGSGKSTLARCVNALVRPDHGRVEVDGLDAARDAVAVRRRVGFVFSDPDAQIVMPTPAEDVALSLRRLRLGRQETAHRVRAALEMVGLDDRAEQAAHTLSSGQKQLLALASVTVAEPSVLVADEPTTLLDLRNARRVADLLHRLTQQVLLVTHDLELLTAPGRWDRVVCLDEGRVVADGDPVDVVSFYRRRMLRDAEGGP